MHIRRQSVVHLLIGVAGTALGLQSTQATDTVWTGSGDGVSFGDSLNWLPTSVPRQFDVAIFDIAFTVTVGSGVQNQRLQVGGIGTLDLLGSFYSLNGPFTTVDVQGSLGVSNGALNSDGGADLSGDLSLTNMTWSNSGFLDIPGSLTLSSSSVEQHGSATVGPFGSLNIDNFSGLSVDSQVQMSGPGGNSSLTVTNDSFLFATGLSAGQDPGTYNITVQNSSGLLLTGPFADAFLASVPGSNVIVNVIGPFSNWFNERNLTVSDGGSATFNIMNGFVECRQGRIRPGLSETVSVTVSGNMAGWVMSGEFDMGSGEGTTTMVIENGAFVDAAAAFIAEDGSGPTTLTVTKLDSEFFVIGELGIGTGAVIVSNGASMDSGHAIIGGEGGGGSVTVTDLGSSWLNLGPLLVGALADGSVHITAGGVVYSGDAVVGLFAGVSGSCDVSGAASTWVSLGDIDIARFGSGTLTVNLGAAVSSTNGFVGGFAGSSGTATIDGTGSSWDNLGFLTIGGNAGTGSVMVSNGGSISAWQVNVGANGSLVLSQAASASAGQFIVAENGSVGGNGTLTSVNDVMNAGTMSPGVSVGQLDVDGSYVQTVTGGLDIELACNGSDLLSVSGSAQLAGTLNLSVVVGSEPLLGQQITILTGTPVSGAFTTVNSPIAVDVTYEPGAVVVTALAGGSPTPGDLDGDGIVGITDFLALLAAWGPNPGHPADFDNDGIVGITDFLTLLANWGPVGCP